MDPSQPWQVSRLNGDESVASFKEAAGVPKINVHLSQPEEAAADIPGTEGGEMSVEESKAIAVIESTLAKIREDGHSSVPRYFP